MPSDTSRLRQSTRTLGRGFRLARTQEMDRGAAASLRHYGTDDDDDDDDDAIYSTLFSDYRKWCSLLHISYHYKTQVIVHLYPKLNYRI